MENWLNTYQLPYAFLLILPGFISLRVFALLVPVRDSTASRDLFDAFAYGMLNLGIWIGPILLFWPRLNGHPVYGLLATFAALVLSPVLLAYGAVWALTSEFLKRSVIHPSPTAWDYYFSVRDQGWVRVRTRGGAFVGGYYGSGSFASSYPHQRDLYLQQEWRLGASGEFLEPVPQTNGVLVSLAAGDILEFYKPEDLQHVKNRREQDSTDSAPRGLSAGNAATRVPPLE